MDSDASMETTGYDLRIGDVFAIENRPGEYVAITDGGPMRGASLLVRPVDAIRASEMGSMLMSQSVTIIRKAQS